MTDFYAEVAEDVSFGDIFDADFLHDVFLKADAVQLGSRDVQEKHGGGLSYAANYERNRKYVLGRGGPYRALLIADNCLVDRVLAQGQIERRPQGRLLFAPIIETSSSEELKDFGRFALPEWPGRLPASVAELRRCFMVDAPDIVSHREHRVGRLTTGAAAELEVQWNAYAARRGPLANARNAEKVAELATRGAGAGGEPDQELAYLVAGALAAGWQVEGDSLEAVADAYSEGRSGDSELQDLEAALRELGEKSIQAADSLAAKKTPPTTDS